MLWNVSSLGGYAVVASGEHAGKIADFLFEQPGWGITALVIETGSWLQSRRVRVPIAAFSQPVVETRTITLKLTAQEMGELPDETHGQSNAPAISLEAIAHAAVEGSDANVGRIEDFLIDAAVWTIKYLVVNPSGWLSEEKILMPVGVVHAIAETEAIVQLSVTREFVKAGPHYDPDLTADGAYDDQFLTYYGIRFAKV